MCAMETVELTVSTHRNEARSRLNFFTGDLLENPTKCGVHNGNSGIGCLNSSKPGEIEAEPFGETIDRLARELRFGGGFRDIAVVLSEQVLQKGFLDGFGLFITHLKK